MSLRSQWAGWGQDRNSRHGKRFHFVRKSDPREEFIRKGYFLENGKFFYITRKSKVNETLSENTLRLQCDNSVFVIREPESGKEICMSSTFALRMDF